MWGTDGPFGSYHGPTTAGAGVFTAVDALERRVCSAGIVCQDAATAIAALQPISMGERMQRELSWLDRGRRRNRGLALRMDHGSQYLSDHFTKCRSNVLAASLAVPYGRFARSSPRPTASPSGSIASLPGTDHPWSQSTATSMELRDGRPRLKPSPNSNLMPSGSSKRTAT